MIYPKDSAGHRGVDTSVEGVAHINQDLPRLQRMVRAAIALAGEKGATGDEIAASLDWSRYRVRPRTSELRAQGRIADSGKRRKNEASGVSAIVWVLPEYVQEDAA